MSDEEENEYKGHPGMRRVRFLRDCRRKQEMELELNQRPQQEQKNTCVTCDPRHVRGRQKKKHQSAEEDENICPCSHLKENKVANANKVVDENNEGHERSRSVRLTTNVSEEDGVAVITLGDTDEEDGCENPKIKVAEKSELDQITALDYMATPVVNREEDDKVVFHPTFLIEDGKWSFRVMERLGSGAYGNVYKVEDCSNGKIRALKVMRKDRTDNDEKESIMREINALTTIKNRNPPAFVTKVIVRLLQTFKLKDHQFIMYELLGPTLHDAMRHDACNVGWNWKEIRQISYQMLVAINYLHSLELVHHDIKPENICFRPGYEIGCGMNPHVKLLDFGSCVSVFFRDGRIATTLRYRSPEIGMKGRCSFGVDMWSLGCTLFEIYTRYPLFILSDNKNEVEKFYMMEAILCDVIPRRLAINSRLDCFDENGHLKYDDENKLKIKAIHERIKPLEEYNETPKHETASQFFNLLKKLLVMKSVDRLDSYTALHHPFFNQDVHHEYEPIITPTLANLEAFLRKSSSSHPMSFKMKDDPELRKLCGPRAFRQNTHVKQLG